MDARKDQKQEIAGLAEQLDVARKSIVQSEQYMKQLYEYTREARLFLDKSSEILSRGELSSHFVEHISKYIRILESIKQLLPMKEIELFIERETKKRLDLDIAAKKQAAMAVKEREFRLMQEVKELREKVQVYETPSTEELSEEIA